MLNRLDSFFIKIGTESDSFSITFERQFPPGSQIHATNSLSLVSELGPNSLSFAQASIDAYSVHLADGEGPLVYLPGDDLNAISVRNCARILFRLTGGRIIARCLINIYTF
jgi:hypothetical protein